jgi:hypothetical protein
MSIFWRLLRPEFVRERGSTLLGTATTSSTSDSSTSTTITTTRINADGSVETKTTTTVTAPAATADDDTSEDTSAEDQSYVIIDDGDKFKVMKLLRPLLIIRIHICLCFMCSADAVVLLRC